MSVAEIEACDAIALGFPPYRRSPLPSRTYQAFTHFLGLFDQPSHLISPPPPIPSQTLPQSELGHEIQDKEEICFTKNNSLTENEVEDNETITHFPEGKEDGEEEEEKEERVVGEAEIEDGEISDIILPHALDFDDTTQSGEPDVALGQIHKDKQGEFPASIEKKGAYESDALVNSSDVGVGTSRETLCLEELKKKQVELSCRKICSYEEIVGDYGICDAEKEVKRSKASSKPDDADKLKRTVDINEGREAGSKRKRTEHSKKNKKEKRRKKRAEENRKSGVKRLRLEPNPKKKTVNYCRYFLHGKCQQGDSCKFSHDTAPLTKSTVPCTHFAINNCLKGDNCPYDHDLSKYPCNNYKATGFCHRGDKCFFSHKISLMNDPSPVSDVNKNTQEAYSLQARASSGKKLPTNGRTSQLTPMKPPANVPKGMNFLSFGKNSPDGSSKQEKGESPTVRGNEITVSRINQGAVEKSHNSNERLWSPTPPAVSGTNQGAAEKLPVPQFLKMMTNRQDKSTSNSAPPLKTQVKSTSNSAQKVQPFSTQFSSKYSAPSTASVGNLPTISNILQEFLFNGQ